MYKVTNYDSDTIDNFTSIPEGLASITEKEYMRSVFFILPPTHIGFRQVKIEGQTFNIKMFYYHDNTGIAISNDHGKLSYFRFGCFHDYEVTNIGKCLNKYECKKCGFSHGVDSSD